MVVGYDTHKKKERGKEGDSRMRKGKAEGAQVEKRG